MLRRLLHIAFPIAIGILPILILFMPEDSSAQLTPIGNWTDHLPYRQAIQVVSGNDKIWCATSFSMFSIDKKENSIERLSKVNGLHDAGISCMGMQESNGVIVIAYKNGNIDILQSPSVINIPTIKNSSIVGDKSIFHIHASNNYAYLSADNGIFVIDLKKFEVKDTYIIGNNGSKIRVNAVSSDNNYLYAATEEGLKKASRNAPNLADFRSWQLLSGTNGLPGGATKDVATISDQVIALKEDSLFISSANNWNFLYADGWPVADMNSSGGKIILSEMQNNMGRVVVLTMAGAVEKIIQDNTFIIAPRQTAFTDNSYWIADSLAGLSKFNGIRFDSYIPNSPFSDASGEMTWRNGKLWVTAGSVNKNWEPMNNKNGLYQFSEHRWKNVNNTSYPALDSVPDLITAAIDVRNESIWVGSYGGGLINISSNNILSVYKQNSPLQPASFSSNSYRISGLAFDAENNEWISNYGANQNLLVRKADNSWRSFTVPFPLAENALAQILVDGENQKWIVAPKAQGLICFNHGQSIDNPGDDRWKWYRSGKGNGNLPDNNVLSIAKDKNNFIWIGTAQGVGIIQCPQEVFTPQGCEAILPVVQQDNFAGYLFRDEQVQCIAVDGADRKWIGTLNGAWLISADGEKTIYRFTEDNSPLPANDVNHIAIDGNSGEVFFSTSMGICSFRSTATEGNNVNNNVLVFPNPVPPGYAGTIAIRGIVNNALVKITELDGRLVYETRALGGQAIWNGKNYKGQTISTGVYLVFITDDNKKEKIVTKIVFVKK